MLLKNCSNSWLILWALVEEELKYVIDIQLASSEWPLPSIADSHSSIVSFGERATFFLDDLGQFESIQGIKVKSLESCLMYLFYPEKLLRTARSDTLTTWRIKSDSICNPNEFVNKKFFHLPLFRLARAQEYDSEVFKRRSHEEVNQGSLNVKRGWGRHKRGWIQNE